MTVARHVVVHGRVQGVFFRDAARRRARRAGVAGWVRNNPDGTVEAWVEGEPEDVAVLVDFLGQGPPDAAVERVEVAERDPESHRDFEIR